MKLSIVTLTALIALSTTASADWMNGANNSTGKSQGSGTTNTYGTGNGNVYGMSKSDGQVWGKGQGNADAAIDFSISFKGKGRSDMASDIAVQGQGDYAGNSSANGNANTAANANTFANTLANTNNTASGFPNNWTPNGNNFSMPTMPWDNTNGKYYSMPTMPWSNNNGNNFAMPSMPWSNNAQNYSIPWNANSHANNFLMPPITSIPQAPAIYPTPTQMQQIIARQQAQQQAFIKQLQALGIQMPAPLPVTPIPSPK